MSPQGVAFSIGVFHLMLSIVQYECASETHTESSSNLYRSLDRNLEPSDDNATLLCKISEKTGCSLCHYRQIRRDLKPFSEGISREDLNRAAKFGVRYQIIQGRVFRQKECMFPFRCSGIEHFLLRLAPKLPDLEFIVNVRDYPQSPVGREKLPVFSFSKVPKNYYDILYPAWTFWEGGPAISIYPRGIGRWDIRSKSLIAESERVPWDAKVDRGFFRGSRTSAERDPLIKLSRRLPELVDAMYTKNQAWKSDRDTLGAPPAAEVSFEDHCKFKFLFNFRGVAASFRFKHLFLCKSLVFHFGPTQSENDWIEFFYPMLKPWKHYIPISQNEVDQLETVIEYFKEHQEVSQSIAERGFEAIQRHLRMKDIQCYWRKLLKSYAALMKFEVQRDRTLYEIKTKTEGSSAGGGVTSVPDRDEL
ncbi:O-glucosyltransferase rumi homolog [Galendromus occidentalis]|uniref:O-glucosyltransferase rumi homolog n=1 Tax=Galendromus occidentalis TaxID=34638 RepID=A0AAJ7SF65_9ACAR|nr:O-glucosyltransferase rumi homolog [Galendromus occidentalis]